ncbi:MAG: PHP domain-containing protein [Gemmatimonadetes bacterium]|nr:PHP domain-containing protein [Gemmatimonadota bacterium]MYA77974.1 PHP domain-containing protein [Gemmatimonadota bacterium]MYG15831.1 PHP domain-containing protein [Gemmatimonadota bacterium]MYH18689.1 PHP domain-containing protein [Gemmatimonadota bacterium]MYK98731.1 PHP domain-containing protein [Gemmatimonadota bacterium]
MSVECYIDLHAHSVCSDGVDTPEELVSKACAAGLCALAITDHDAVDGVERARRESARRESARRESAGDESVRDLEIVPGVELSARDGDSDVHILGYFFDPGNRSLLSYLETFRSQRLHRAKGIVRKLNDLGVPLELESVIAHAQDGKTSVGRPHIARALVESNQADTIQDAFTRYLGNHAPAYLPKVFFAVEDAIRVIHEAGGAAVLAHPGSLRRDELIPGFVKSGLDGLEVIHPDHSGTARRYYGQLAAKHGLVATGGSDYHGPRADRCGLGGMKVPLHHLTELKRILA